MCRLGSAGRVVADLHGGLAQASAERLAAQKQGRGYQ